MFRTSDVITLVSAQSSYTQTYLKLIEDFSFQNYNLFCLCRVPRNSRNIFIGIIISYKLILLLFHLIVCKNISTQSLRFDLFLCLCKYSSGTSANLMQQSVPYQSTYIIMPISNPHTADRSSAYNHNIISPGVRSTATTRNH